MAQTYKLIYISQASDEISYRDIEDILGNSRKNNASQNVTGLLIFNDGFFIQYLEADNEATLKFILAKIVQDQRHSKLRVISEWPCDHRSFSEWSMAFLDNDISEKSEPFIQKLFADSMLTAVPNDEQFISFFQNFMQSQPLLK